MSSESRPGDHSRDLRRRCDQLDVPHEPVLGHHLLAQTAQCEAVPWRRLSNNAEKHQKASKIIKKHQDLEGEKLLQGNVNFPRPIIDRIWPTTIEECLDERFSFLDRSSKGLQSCVRAIFGCQEIGL